MLFFLFMFLFFVFFSTCFAVPKEKINQEKTDTNDSLTPPEKKRGQKNNTHTKTLPPPLSSPSLAEFFTVSLPDLILRGCRSVTILRWNERRRRKQKTTSGPLAGTRRKPHSHPAVVAANTALTASPPHQIPQGRDERSAPGLMEDGRSENGAGEDGQLPEAREQALI